MAFRRRTAVRGKRRGTNWQATTLPTTQSLSSNGDPKSLASFSLATGSVLQSTIVRVRGSVFLAHLGSAIGSQYVGVGLALCSDKEVAAGASALPRPLSDGSDDRWMWHWSGVIGFDNTTGANFEGFTWRSFEFDSKAMRKWDETEDICVIGENRALSGTIASVLGSAWFRILSKVA